MHGQGGFDPDVGDVVNVVRTEGSALAGDQRPVLAAAAVRYLLQQCAGPLTSVSAGQGNDADDCS